MSNFSDRALREQAQLDGNGLDRDLFTKVLSHANHYYRLRRREILRDLFRSAGDRHVLEIGSQCWFQWMEGLRIKPETLICINILARAIQQGKQKARGAGIRPQFFLMDAHNLEFPDNSFDLVFGNAILHHLDLDQAFDEIERVLRPAGKMVFCEPLGVNPAGKIVRRMTPHARTTDEHPLTLADLAALEKRFTVEIFYEQLLSVPFGVVSKVLFSNPENKLMKFAFSLDRIIDGHVSPLRKLYRNCIIAGRSRKSNSAVEGDVNYLRNAC